MILNGVFSAIIILILSTFPVSAAQKKPVYGSHGAVASADIIATRIGLDILKQGGNAVDAAVAVGFTLAVTYPQAGNIGGGGFMIVRTGNNEFYALDYREKAPAAAHRDMYLDENKNVIEASSTLGYLASGVPGTVAGLYEAHRRFGKLPWNKLLQPAIEIAENGFEINRYKENSLGYRYEKFLLFPATKAVFTKNGEKYHAGDLLVQKDLAETLKRIRDKGTDGFYSGKTAELIAEAMAENNGLITEEDLADYNAKWREPLEFEYRGYGIISMPPPSSGGLVLAEILNTLENTDIGRLGHNSSAMIHLWVEAERQAYADRAEYMGDADFVSVPVAELISKEYAKQNFYNIDPYFARKSENVHAGLKQIPEHVETTHFSIVDENGMAVSNTYTLNGSFGSCVVIPGTGILMNNEMDDFSIKPGYANMFGLIGNEANAIEAGKRMLSSMTPTMVTRNDSLFMIVGSPGGSTIITTVAQVLSNVIDHGMNIREAVEAPKFHHQWLPDYIRYERLGFPVDVLNNLRNMGHQLQKTDALGDTHAVLWDNKHKEWTAWSDPKKNGQALAY